VFSLPLYCFASSPFAAITTASLLLLAVGDEGESARGADEVEEEADENKHKTKKRGSINTRRESNASEDRTKKRQL
jgi:hypothetical protein